MEQKAITIAEDEKFLRTISGEVNLKDKSYLEDIKKLEEYCISHEVLALAAIQIGIPKRLVYIKNTNVENLYDDELNERRVLVNPVIIKREGYTKYWEACASCLDNTGLVARPYKIKAEYYDVYGKKKKEIFRGFEATVLSHEYDHLNGVLHMDISEENMIMPKDERKIFRETNGYKIIARKGDFEEHNKK